MIAGEEQRGGRGRGDQRRDQRPDTARASQPHPGRVRPARAGSVWPTAYAGNAQLGEQNRLDAGSDRRARGPFPAEAVEFAARPGVGHRVNDVDFLGRQLANDIPDHVCYFSHR
jgi:hypothetical protein